MSDIITIKFETTRDNLQRMYNSLRSDITYYEEGLEYLYKLENAASEEEFKGLLEEFGMDIMLTMEGVKLRIAETSALLTTYKSFILQAAKILETTDQKEITLHTVSQEEFSDLLEQGMED